MREHEHIHIHIHLDSVDEAVIKHLLSPLSKLGAKIMATLQDLKDKVALLTTTIADEKAEVTAKLAELSTQIQALKDQLAAGTLVTQADLDGLAAQVDALTIAAEDITVPDAPV